MNRRRFLYGGTSAAVWAMLPTGARAQGLATGTASASLTVLSETTGKVIPSGFTGLSYESAQLSHPGFFSAENSKLIGLFRRLGPRGVLRIGGGTSEFTMWTPDGVQSGAQDIINVGPDVGAAKRNTVVTPLAIQNLAGFLDAAGWDLIYGLNLGHGTAERAAEEAAFVTKCIGSRLIALQIGNEPDGYSKHGLRPPDWGYQDYVKQWKDWAQAIQKRVPGVHLAGPDVASKTDWVEEFAKQAGDDIVLLTSHYYAEGPPTDPRMNIDFLLKPHPGLQDKFQHLVQAATEANIPYRLSEGNTCYHGGKKGVSNVFAAALWGADFMFLLAECGVNGIKFHGGGTGNYTPIASSELTDFTARPIYYGMLLFSYFADSTLLPVTLDAGGANLTAYAARNKQNKLRVALINRDLQRPVTATISSDFDRGKARVLSLSAPSVESTIGVTLGGSEVTPDGMWKPTRQEDIHVQNGAMRIDVPVASAALVLFE